MSGHGPPADVPPSELWARLSTAKRAFEVVDFPRNDPSTGQPIGKLALWPLTHSELVICKAEATRKARAIIREKFDHVERVEGYAQVYEDATSAEMIFRFCRRVENPELPVFPTAQHASDKLTADEAAVLINQYALVQMKLGPIVAYMTPVECEAWILRLREGGSAYPLALLSPEQKTALIMFLVERSASSPTDNSSATRPPEEPTSSASNS